jgi:ketosteroid isomerase-like protein
MRSLLLATTAFFAACTLTVVTPDSDRKALTAQAEAWDKAIVAKDRGGIEVNMWPDFRQIRGGGHVASRDDFVKDVLDPAFSMDPYVVEDFEIRLFGDTALLYGRIRMAGRDGADRWNAHFRYIDTYVRRDGQWKVVSVQVTPMSQ